MTWWKKAVFYQIYPRSFADSNGDGVGDLPGIMEKLDYLNDGTSRSLGVDAIWFSPFFVSPDYDYGYDVADYCAIDPRYGTMEDFHQLLRECHRRNIRVVLDLVLNHTSHLHPWFKESRSSWLSPKREWYLWKKGKRGGKKPPNNWRSNFFGSAWKYDKQTGQYYLHSFLKEQPDLNWNNSQVREAMWKVVRFWLEKGVDGFRLDVPYLLCKHPGFYDNPLFFRYRKVIDGPSWRERSLKENLMDFFKAPEFQVKRYNSHQSETHRVLKEFRKVLDSYPDKTSVGEIHGEPSEIVSYYGEEDELHMNFLFDFNRCRWSAGAFRSCMERWGRLLPPEAWPAHAFSNHDQVRAISRYDQWGKGDSRARLLCLMLLTLRGTPFIYYGEEIGMKESLLPRQYLRDPVGRKWYPLDRGRDGARTPMQWSSEEPAAGFTTGEPWLPVGPELEARNVERQKNDPRSMWSLYHRLIRLRKENSSLQEGDMKLVTDGVPDDCLVYRREKEDQSFLIALNFSNNQRRISAGPPGNLSLLLSTYPERIGEIRTGFLVLNPLEGCLLRENTLIRKD